MSRFSMGQPFQAQRLLDEANVLADEYLKRKRNQTKKGFHSVRLDWKRIVALQALRKEATDKIAD